jgi:hypothetical protein
MAALPDGAVIVIVLLCAGFAVLIGYSATRFYFQDYNDIDRHTVNVDQAQYMREVRDRARKAMRPISR